MIWALGTGKSNSTPVSGRPLITSGARESPALPEISAPISLNGSISLSIGRERREASPVMIVRKGRPARRPQRSRIAVALSRASSTSVASLRPSAPLPCMDTVGRPPGPVLRMGTPKALRQEIVARQSPPGAKFDIVALPLAMLLRMAARWEIDLSPGGVISPCSERDSAIVIVACACIIMQIAVPEVLLGIPWPSTRPSQHALLL